MKKKILSLLLVAGLSVSLFAGCGSGAADADKATAEGGKEAASDLKIGAILIGDETETYSKAHIDGIKEAAKELGIPENNIEWKERIDESEDCYDAAKALVADGCTLVISNSYGHQDYIAEAAEEFTDVNFVSMTGDYAAISGLDNYYNAFTNVYESRYVSGVVAGMKIAELDKNGEIPKDGYDEDGNVKVGYVGAYPYAEVKSGYTAFFLGVRSVCPSATMKVIYTNSWASIDLEKEAAESLIADGCVLISQHADTTGASTACEKAGVPIVGYNVSMIATAPTQALTSASIDWGPYYTYAVKSVIDGTKIDTDWCKGYDDGADKITELNDKAIAKGTKEKVKEVEDAIKDGSLHVFDTSTFTVDGKELDSWKDDNGNEYIKDGYFHESELHSAPAFAINIDGIESVEK